MPKSQCRRCQHSIGGARLPPRACSCSSKLAAGAPGNSHTHAFLLACLQVVHYASDGWLLHKTSENARKQLEQDKAEAEATARFQAEMDRALKEKVCLSCSCVCAACWPYRVHVVLVHP